MFRLALRRLLLPTAALALFALAPSAHAEIVEYYTIGLFGSDSVGSNPFNGTTHLEGDAVASGASTITYNNADVGASVGDHSYLLTFPNFLTTQGDFGNFLVTSTSPGGEEDTFSTTFTLSIFQEQPNTGNGSLVATVSGQINGEINAISSNVVLTFTPTNISLPAGNSPTVFYTVNSPVTLDGGSPNAMTSLNGTVTLAPLPASASTGFSLFAALGVLGFVFRKRLKVA